MSVGQSTLHTGHVEFLTNVDQGLGLMLWPDTPELAHVCALAVRMDVYPAVAVSGPAAGVIAYLLFDVRVTAPGAVQADDIMSPDIARHTDAMEALAIRCEGDFV